MHKFPNIMRHDNDDVPIIFLGEENEEKGAYVYVGGMMVNLIAKGDQLVITTWYYEDGCDDAIMHSMQGIPINPLPPKE